MRKVVELHGVLLKNGKAALQLTEGAPPDLRSD